MDIVSRTIEINDDLSVIISYDPKRKLVWSQYTGFKTEKDVVKWGAVLLEQTQNDIALFKDVYENQIQ